MKKNQKGFTLIEMIVWVSLTMVLMVSVWIFVSSGMANITIQKKVLDESSSISNLWDTFNTIFGENFEIINNTSTSVLVASNYTLGNPKYYSLWLVTATGYCQNNTGAENKYLEIKNFNPFILTGAIYSGSYIDHVIYSWWQIIVGKWVFWDAFLDGSNGTGIYLNNPAGIAYSGSNLFLSDSGNNKILFMSGNQIYKLLDIDDGIYNPTWLLYKGWILYILNSGKNELLALTSKSYSNTSWNPINIRFQPTSTVNNIKKIEIEVLPDDFILTGVYSSGSFNFSWFSKNLSWDVWWIGATNKLLYTFSGSKNFNNTIYSINTIISWTFTASTSYYLKLNLLDVSDNILYEKYYPYLTNGDNDFITLDNNVLKVLTGWINGDVSDISSSWWKLLLKDFITWKYLKLDTDGTFVASWSLSPFHIDDFEIKKEISDLKIKDFSIINDGKIITLKLEYYKIFSCYNEKDSVVKTMIIKKAISH